MKPRRLCLLVFLMLAPLVAGAGTLNTLIVISAKAPKPKLDPIFGGHFQTLLWPPAFDGDANRLLSLISGVNWRGEKLDGSFRPGVGDRGFDAVAYVSLQRRGYLAVRSKLLAGTPVFAVSSPVGVGSANPGSLLMAVGLAGPNVVPVPFKGPLPKEGLLAFEADSWDQATDLSSRTTGRVLIVEMPTTLNATGGDFYLSGRGWPDSPGAGLPVDPSTGIAGLIRARSAVELLQHPEHFEWRESPDAKDVAWRWFPYVRQASLVLLPAGMTLLAVIIGIATYAISLEQRGRLAASLLVAAVMTPATLLEAGALSRHIGLDNQLAWLILAEVITTVALGVAYLVIRRLFPGAHPLLAASLIGLTACVLFDPKWSLMSGIFGYNVSQTSPEATGALLAYLTGVIAFSHGSSPAAAWFGRFALAGVLVLGLAGDAWWAPDRVQAVLLPVIALFSGEAWMRWPWLFILGFVPNMHTDVVRHGFAWSPVGCLTDAKGFGAVNLFDYAAFAAYPGVWAMGLIVVYVSLFGGGFVIRQFRIVIRQDPRNLALPWAAAGLAAASLFNPALLPGAMFVAFGALVSVFHAAVWTL